MRFLQNNFVNFCSISLLNLQAREACPFMKVIPFEENFVGSLTSFARVTTDAEFEWPSVD